MLVGSGAGGIDVAERQYFEFFNDGWKRVTPYAIPVSIVGMISSEISIALGLHGISHVLSTGCTSSTDAIGYAASLHPRRRGGRDPVRRRRRLRHARDDLRLLEDARGVDAATTTRRPRRRARSIAGRDGFVLGEGAWMVVLEREDRARARGATIYATIDGYGSTCDAYHRVQMDPDGEQIVRAMQRWRSSAPAARSRRSATSTTTARRRVLNDAVESRCVRRLFGAPRRPRAGIVDQVDDRPPAGRQRRRRHRHDRAGAVARLPAADDQPARAAIPDCDLDFIPNTGRAASPAAALCNCLGFGSKNSAIVLGAADADACLNPADPNPHHATPSARLRASDVATPYDSDRSGVGELRRERSGRVVRCST